ncbi:ImmA/IrrE family metallo-endopeptidase [Isoptericola dokdonensis]|uniref:IrrE N-terminal-like domain-containing protein n=1 Tax=Isoptericola dokdonensis DS-3 TaxID=1300344 RepID=A0A168FEV9_9MICO|nr:ImmA/IrrE family metallo-endopeptidase [Isoptericola dokdonensis]ANC31551.1 hypothetical protein I598_2005 [Isoptericola dokdonensis DS-3]
MLVKEKAANDAADVLEAYWAAGYPVDPDRIAAQLDMDVIRATFNESISGMLRVEPGDRPVIYVDDRDSEQRQRFTIAHEIGHYVERNSRGETDFNFIDRRGGGYDAHELYADEFAANLLMPSHYVKQLHADGINPGVMARRMNVSLQAMQIRLRRLGLL